MNTIHRTVSSAIELIAILLGAGSIACVLAAAIIFLMTDEMLLLLTIGAIAIKFVFYCIAATAVAWIIRPTEPERDPRLPPPLPEWFTNGKK